jgi:drug/metabolite transporter (DMT)-like permease
VIILKQILWLVYIILAALSWAIWSILIKFISADLSLYSYKILFTIGMLLSLPLAIRRCKRDVINLKGIVFGVCASLLTIIGNISVYKSLMLGGQASVVFPFTNL